MDKKQYRLKNNAADFEVVDGKFAGRKFVAGETYREIPPMEAEKFETIPLTAGGAKEGTMEECIYPEVQDA